MASHSNAAVSWQIVYAVHWNHRKDHHLRRADLESRFSRPALLITDACSAHKGPLDVHRRDAEFISLIANTLKSDGENCSQSPELGPCKSVCLLSESA